MCLGYLTTRIFVKFMTQIAKLTGNENKIRTQQGPFHLYMNKFSYRFSAWQNLWIFGSLFHTCEMDDEACLYWFSHN